MIGGWFSSYTSGGKQRVALACNLLASVSQQSSIEDTRQIAILVVSTDATIEDRPSFKGRIMMDRAAALRLSEELKHYAECKLGE